VTVKELALFQPTSRGPAYSKINPWFPLTKKNHTLLLITVIAISIQIEPSSWKFRGENISLHFLLKI
jgi:hypothetical protein